MSLLRALCGPHHNSLVFLQAIDRFGRLSFDEWLEENDKQKAIIRGRAQSTTDKMNVEIQTVTKLVVPAVKMFQ